MDAQPQMKLNLTPKRSRQQTILYVVLALFVLALAIDGIFGAHGLISTYRMRLQVKQERQQVQELKQENREFTEQVRELKSNPSAIARVAHERMGLVKPGELVFNLPPKSSKNGSQPQSSSSQK